MALLDHRAARGRMNPDPGYAVGWGTLSLINLELAQTKGFSGLAWFFVSLLLGPVATFLFVVLEPKDPLWAEGPALASETPCTSGAIRLSKRERRVEIRWPSFQRAK